MFAFASFAISAIFFLCSFSYVSSIKLCGIPGAPACKRREISLYKRATDTFPDLSSAIASTSYYNISEGTYCHVSGSNLCVSPDVIAICANHSTVLLNCPTVLGYPKGRGSACVETNSSYGLTRGLCQIGSSNYSTSANSSNFDNANVINVTTSVSSGSTSTHSKRSSGISLSYTNIVDQPILFTRDSSMDWSCNMTLCNTDYPYLVNTCFNGTQYPVNCNSALRTPFGGATCRNIGYKGQGICVYTNDSRIPVADDHVIVNTTSKINPNITSVFNYRDNAFLW
ncbi:hypothetical protein POMI540_4269 [Schizosaccharomyces pombe]|uniref:Uncharacterized protein C306.11 n=1 Tax=Schizosaccharomyces pombe (strain 972 / ATCC 24843) TaxID=284812 RepID=YJFB_SCHPO|nr:uncharacterized protein SPCC306.11 [Schizosaccharomyces pombe]Q9Y7R9.1 RecName: Full=Uncharacterized protein C306.11; Flags: Precursor [Schizosaccharomyces pombe 972h-]CAB41659.1 sequence orphan [Schizosaccharomyces pombe]|eukprot:NP_587818.1 uncharacterized protein SPCC306.11 [Schizosaccharomyces pombe]